MSKKSTLEKHYPALLPVEIQPLPPVILHNPISVAYFLFCYLFPRRPQSISCTGYLSDCDRFVKITDPDNMQVLWSMGFFGKGTLSRSEPSWWIRTSRRLGLDVGKRLTAEEITQARRDQRQKYKLERSRIERMELQKRQLEDEGKREEAGELGNEIARISAVNERSMNSNDLSFSFPGHVRAEDEEILVDGKLPQLEFLQLMPVEAFFLQAYLNVLKIFSGDKPMNSNALFYRFCQIDDRFPVMFAVYYYYRSLGWCVRSGVKFGVDFVLYKRGPPFSHAEYCIMVVSGDKDAKSKPWWWNAGLGRVVGNVRKTLIFSYVMKPTMQDSIEDMNLQDIKRYISRFCLKEVIYRRWIPGRNRD